MKQMMVIAGIVFWSFVAMGMSNGGPYREMVGDIEWTYFVSDGNAEIRSGINLNAAIPQSTAGSISIPASLSGWPVTSIGDHAFWYCTNITSCTIPIGVTNIGTTAFFWCTNLTTVAIPETVATIGKSAFAGCESLKNIAVACSNPAFAEIDGVVYDKQVEILVAFPCGKTEVAIPETVKTIGIGAFRGCKTLTSVVLPNGLTNIAQQGFAACFNMENITIPASVVTLGRWSFFQCDNMVNIAFEGAPPTGIDIANIRQDVAIRYNIAYEAEWLPVIEACGFTDAASYTPPKPDGGPYTETVGETEWTFMVSGGKASVTQANPATGAVTIPSTLGGRSVTSIDASAFQQCTGLTSVTIPASVTTIGNSAFWGCTQLADVYFEGDTISSIERDAFTGCYWDLIMHVPSTWQGRGRTICGYTVLKGSMFIVK